jgi:sterol desaturase/sphingolipid hydroxylase (fatty acid hydroxylase superfamily)
MNTYASLLLWVVPAFYLLIIIEVLYGHYKKNQTYNLMDTIASLSSGTTNLLKDILGLTIIIISYPFLLSKLSLFDIENNLWVYIIAFICIDFSSYWNHRLNHKINIFWNQHVIHHSSEEFNLACALRQSISNFLGYGALFLIPAAIFGIQHEVIGLLLPLHLFGQFWYHTRHIGKLGILEYIIVTPSQHRVHHAINPVYIDKNLGAIFCVWDRWFGTFQEELDDEPPVYGVLKPVSTWNPILINFTHIWGLILDFFRTKSLKEKLILWFMPTGYRPEDVVEKYPIDKIVDVHNFDKYSPPTNKLVTSWVLFQWLSTNILVFFFLSNFSKFTTQQSLIFGGIIFLSIFSYSAVMDGFKWAYKLEIIRNILCLFLFITPSQFEFYSVNLIYVFFFAVIYFSIGAVSSIVLNWSLKEKLMEA